MLLPFVHAESVEAHQRSYELGIQIGHQRRNKDVLAWVKKRRRTIRREDLISFLCGKAPPPRNSRAPPRLAMVSPSRPTSSETSSSVETDLQPFREAIALHGKLLTCFCILCGSVHTCMLRVSKQTCSQTVLRTWIPSFTQRPSFVVQ